jgi:hypothetical protein
MRRRRQQALAADLFGVLPISCARVHNSHRKTPVGAEAIQSDYIALYKRAFAEYRSQALWNMRAFDEPSPEDALVVARALRKEGDLPARSLAEQIERACHAAK